MPTYPSDSSSALAVPAASHSSQIFAITAAPSQTRKFLVPGAILSLLALAAAGYLLRRSFGPPGMAAAAFQNPTIASLTSSGDVTLARISPDGRYLAYVSYKNGQFSLWVRQIAIASAVQVIPPATKIIGDVAFTPDGNFLDYSVSSSEDTSGKVYQVPVLGGTPRRVLDSSNGAITFSPDGSSMAYSSLDVPANEVDLMVTKLDGGAPRKLASRKASYQYGNFHVLHWSPDGKRVAALTTDTGDPNGMLGGLVLIDVDTGALSPMPGRRWRDAHDFTWLPDSSGIVIAALDKSAAPAQLWIVAYPSGTVRRISNDLSDYLSLAMSADGHTIAAVQRNLISALWTAPAGNPDDVRPLTSGRLDGLDGFGLTPDGHVIYAGNHSGNWDLFLADADGGNVRQLTFDNRFHQSPRVCDDGRTVIYGSNAAGGDHLFKSDLQNGGSTQRHQRPRRIVCRLPGNRYLAFLLGTSRRRLQSCFQNADLWRLARPSIRAHRRQPRIPFIGRPPHGVRHA